MNGLTCSLATPHSGSPRTGRGPHERVFVRGVEIFVRGVRDTALNRNGSAPNEPTR